MIRTGLKSLIIATFLTLIAIPFVPTQAQVCTGKDDCKDKINEYEEKLNDAREQKGTLSTEINVINSQIDLSRARLSQTETSIEETEKEIESLGGKIEELDSSLDRLTAVLLQKIVEGYKRRHVNLFDILLSPETATLENQIKYIEIAQENDRAVALKTQQIKSNYAQQKDLRETKVQELHQLEQQLKNQQVQLDQQVSQKEVLLEQTKNDETKYQQLLSQALSEFQAIEQAIATGKEIGQVKKGDAIALVGNTGWPYCSTGAHLHFEVRKGGAWVDPGGYVGDGKDWQHPLSSPVVLTQGYGVTPYSWRYKYSGGIHTGWDMVSKSSEVIRAVADGTLYSSTQNCSGAIIKIRYIDHGDDLVSYYLHVQ